jgi:hypothetical protein
VKPSTSKRPYRRLGLTLALPALALAPACGTTTTTPATTPDLVSVTETFTGSLPVTGFATHPFQVTNTGLLTATLTSLSPQATITVGFGVGQPSGGSCAILSGTESARVGSAVSGTASPGSYCVTIYDLGNEQGANDYVITVTHY